MYQIETLVCGGISSGLREMLAEQDIAIIDNVVCSIEELLEAIRSNKLRSGYSATAVVTSRNLQSKDDSRDPEETSDNQGQRIDGELGRNDSGFDCLECGNRVCLCGEICPLGRKLPNMTSSPEVRSMLDAGLDIAQEQGRRLCRLAEVVYFGLEMGYRKIGVAFCVDMWEPTEILVGVLKRFFEVVPVCCKVGGVTETEMLRGEDPWTEGDNPQVACNPFGQAWVLNRAGTQFNIVVGLCVGSDCLFTMESNVPVTTLFVKDKSLANNPIGALYSEYYLRENVSSVAGRSRADARRESSLRGSFEQARKNTHSTGEKSP